MKCKLVNKNFQSDYLNNLLRARNINIELIINPSQDQLNSPTKLKNIAAGAALYVDKVKNGKKCIALIVDSDNDGFTSSSIIYGYTKRLNPDKEIVVYIHAGKQHGLEDICQKILDSDKDFDLIILPDSSTNDYAYHERLKEVAPCLILDHHELSDGTQLSDNAIIINNQTSPDYPNKQLTGAGVVWQFCRYLDEELGINYANDFIDLAAFGIIGDMGSVVEPENAYIIREGLKAKNIKNVFFKTLIEKQGYSISGKVGASFEDICKKLNPISVAFYLVPLVNATIRVGSFASKEKLVTAFLDGNRLIPSEKRGHKGEMDTAANEAARECTNNRDKQNKIRDEVCDKMEMKIAKYDLLSNQILFIRLEDDDVFPSELNGLIAMRLADKYKRPTIVARLNDEGYIRGSGRGVSQSELTDFRRFLIESGFVEYAEGHDQAFGVSIPDASLRAFHNYANEALSNLNFTESCYDINFERTSNDQDTEELIKEIGSQDNIWGQGNPQPIIKVTLNGVPRAAVQVMGKLNDTVKISVNNVSYMFFKCKRIEDFKKYDKMTITLIGRANLNEWAGKTSAQIMVTDFEITDSILDF